MKYKVGDKVRLKRFTGTDRAQEDRGWEVYSQMTTNYTLNSRQAIFNIYFYKRKPYIRRRLTGDCT